VFLVACKLLPHKDLQWRRGESNPRAYLMNRCQSSAKAALLLFVGAIVGDKTGLVLCHSYDLGLTEPRP